MNEQHTKIIRQKWLTVCGIYVGMFKVVSTEASQAFDPIRALHVILSSAPKLSISQSGQRWSWLQPIGKSLSTSSLNFLGYFHDETHGFKLVHYT